MKAVRNSVSTGANTIEEDVQQLWERVSSEMQNHFNLELSVGEDGKPDWSKARNRVIEAVEGATADILRDLDLKEELGRRFRKRCWAIWSFLIIAILSTGAGVFLNLADLVPWDVLAFGIGALFLSIGAFTGARSVNNIRSFYSAVLNDQRDRLSRAQRQAFGLSANRFFEDFVKLFDPLRSVCRDHKLRHEPQIQGLKDCEKNSIGAGKNSHADR